MSVKHLSVSLGITYPEFTLTLDIEIPLRGTTAVFGPSGSGKSTFLRALAGFVRPDHGHIRFDGVDWFNSASRKFLSPHRRPVGFLFQNSRLFTHLNVEQNLRFADDRARGSAAPFSIDDIVDAFDLAPLLARHSHSLSGGEGQRVALARTLLSRPELLLLDEPLSALDRQRKADILPYLDDLPQKFGIPVLYVSHDIDEIARLANDALILEGGQLKAHGPLIPTLNTHGFDVDRPGAIIEGRVVAHDHRLKLTTIERGHAQIRTPLNERVGLGQETRLRINSRDIVVATSPVLDTSIQNSLPARITRIEKEPTSGFAVISLHTGFGELHAKITLAAVEALDLTADKQVFALIKSAMFEA